MNKFPLLSALLLLLSIAALPSPVFAEPDAASEEESGGGVFSWLSQMKVKMMANQYGLDTATTETLMSILKQEATDKKKMNNEIKAIMTEMEQSLTAGTSNDQELMTRINAIQAKKLELTNIENRTWNNVVELLGTKKASEWILARRGVMDRMSGAVKRAGQKTEGDTATATARPTGQPRRGNW